MKPLLAPMPQVPVRNVRVAKIHLYWEDDFSKGGNDFENVHKFAEFLRDNPELARAVGYVSKTNPNPNPNPNPASGIIGTSTTVKWPESKKF